MGDVIIADGVEKPFIVSQEIYDDLIKNHDFVPMEWNFIIKLDDTTRFESAEEFMAYQKRQVEQYRADERKRQIRDYYLRKIIYLDGETIYFRDNELISFHGVRTVETLAKPGEEVEEDNLVHF